MTLNFCLMLLFEACDACDAGCVAAGGIRSGRLALNMFAALAAVAGGKGRPVQ
jgi:hypothetical protein